MIGCLMFLWMLLAFLEMHIMTQREKPKWAPSWSLWWIMWTVVLAILVYMEEVCYG